MLAAQSTSSPIIDQMAIATFNLTKQFDRQVAVSDVELQVQSGEVYGLIGPNGAGKTTLIRMLATAEEPTLGEIYIHGDRLLRDDSNPHLKQRLGYLPMISPSTMTSMFGIIWTTSRVFIISTNPVVGVV